MSGRLANQNPLLLTDRKNFSKPDCHLLRFAERMALLPNNNSLISLPYQS